MYDKSSDDINVDRTHKTTLTLTYVS